MTSFALFASPKGRCVIGKGAFRHSERPSSEQISFFAPDYLMEEGAPWVIPESVEEISLEELHEICKAKSVSKAPSIEWTDACELTFRSNFKKIQRLIAEGSYEKLVPIVTEYGKLSEKISFEHFSYFLSQLIPLSESGGTLFGLFEEDRPSIVGCTPETLARFRDGEIFTHALAGTAKVSDKTFLTNSKKDNLEHDIVVKDIKESLAKFGDVAVEKTGAEEIGALAHLSTTITVKLSPDRAREKKAEFWREVVTALHPTAALGAYPKPDNGLPFFKTAMLGHPHGRYGAPFGIRYPNGDFHFIVALRALQFFNDEIALASGCGIVAESEAGLEWEELRLKRGVIKQLI